jgi:hypothetical protein
VREEPARDGEDFWRGGEAEGAVGFEEQVVVFGLVGRGVEGEEAADQDEVFVQLGIIDRGVTGQDMFEGGGGDRVAGGAVDFDEWNFCRRRGRGVGGFERGRLGNAAAGAGVGR